MRDLAQHGATMALFMAGKRAHELQEELAVGGFTPETPCAIVNRASWPDECVVRCQLSDLAAALERPEFERQTLVLVGPALAPDPTPA